MNVGYSNSNEENSVDEVCMFCGGNVYINKYATDYMCINKGCLLNENTAMTMVDKLKLILKHYNK